MELAFRSCWVSQRNDGLLLINHDISRSPVTTIKVTVKNAQRYCSPKRPIGVFQIKSFHSEKTPKVFLKN